jgi:hypothetical protein
MQFAGNTERSSRQSPRNNTNGCSPRAACVASAGEDVSICEPSQGWCRSSTKRSASGLRACPNFFLSWRNEGQANFDQPLGLPYIFCIMCQQEIVPPISGQFTARAQRGSRCGQRVSVRPPMRCGYQVIGKYGLFDVTALLSLGSHHIRHRCPRSSISGRSSSLWPS